MLFKKLTFKSLRQTGGVFEDEYIFERIEVL